MTEQAILDIDIVNIETGEVLDIFKNIWMGDVKSIYDRYNIVKIDRFGNSRTVWVIL